MQKALLPLIAPLFVVAALTAGCSYGEEAAKPIPLADDATVKLNGQAERCINMSRLDHSDVIDDNTIDFHVGRKIYRNRLQNRCPGLKNEDRILIEVRGGSLCRGEVVYSLQDLGGRFSPGTPCSLGEFQPIEKVKAPK